MYLQVEKNMENLVEKQVQEKVGEQVDVKGKELV